jgi:hypothetical protein
LFWHSQLLRKDACHHVTLPNQTKPAQKKISSKDIHIMASFTSEYCPPFAPFFGMAGASSAMILSAVGAAYGTAKSGVGIAGMGTFRPDLYVLLFNCF